MSLARVCVITTVVCAQTLLEPSRSAAQEPPAQAQDSLIEAVEQLAADPPTASSVARRILALQDSLEASKSFRFGLSLGWRLFLGDGKRTLSATIDPSNGAVVQDQSDESDVTLSGVVVAYPFGIGQGTQRGVGACFWCSLGFVGNVTLAAFSAESLATFNQSIEGGIGFALAMSSDFALAVILERAFRRRLRDSVVLGQPIMVDGEPLETLSSDDDRFFVDDNTTALSVRFVYFF